MGDELLALCSDLRGTLALMTGKTMDGRRFIKRESKRRLEWTQESTIQAITTTTKCIAQVVQGLLHFCSTQGLADSSSDVRRGGEGGGDEANSSTALGKLFGRLLESLHQAKERMKDLSDRVESKRCIIDGKEEEIRMLKVVLVQKHGTSSWPTPTPTPTQALPISVRPPSAEQLTGLPELVVANEEATEKEDQCSVTRFDASCQTFETSFHSCLVCCDTTHCLLEIRELVGRICQKCDLASLQRSKWLNKTVLSSKGITKWTSECKADLGQLDSFLQHCLDKQEVMRAELRAKNESSRKNVHQIDVLQVQIRDLEASIQGVQTNYQHELATLTDTFAGREAGFKSVSGLLEAQLDDARQEAGVLMRELNERRKSCLDLESEVFCLKEEMEAKDKALEEKILLESHLVTVQGDLKKAQQSLKRHSTELGKSQAEMEALNQQVESLQSKQLSLLDKVGQLEDNHSDLQEDLEKSRMSLQSVTKELMGVKIDRDNAKQQIDTIQTYVSELVEKEGSLRTQVNQFTTEIERLETQIECEKEKHTLLMDYPDPCGNEPVDNKNPASRAERQLAANTVRISLLEEYSDKLRRQSLPKSSATLLPPSKVSSPVPLWRRQDGSISQVHLGKSAANLDNLSPFARDSPSPPLLLQPSPSPVGVGVGRSTSSTTYVAGSGRVAAAGIRGGQTSQLGRLTDQNKEVGEPVKRGGRDAFATMQRARRLARTIASAEGRKKHIEGNTTITF